METYKLTIIMPSFNKAKYIKEALDSIFIQKTNYPYQIIVADDCSTDGTVEIVEKYKKEHKNITLLKSEQNQGLYKNVLRAYEICKTDYFCVLDPDDYWIDEYKIQKSIDFLEKNPDYTIYVTNTIKLNPDGTQEKYNDNMEKDSTLDDYLVNKAVLGCTLGSMYRNTVFKNGLPYKMKNLPDKSFERTFRGDSFRNFLHLQNGKAHAVRDFDAVYRITDEGLWQGSSELEQNMLNTLLFVNLYKYSDEKYPELLVLAYKIFTFRIKKRNLHLDCTENIESIKQYLDLERIFAKNTKLIEKTMYKNLKFKYKLFYFFYKKIYTKLTAKEIE